MASLQAECPRDSFGFFDTSKDNQDTARGTLKYLKKKPKYYVSSNDGKRGFCVDCGSRIVWQALAPENDWLTNVTVGSLDHPAEARVTRHIYADTRLPWYHVCEELPKLTEHDAELLIELLRSEHRPE